MTTWAEHFFFHFQFPTIFSIIHNIVTLLIPNLKYQQFWYYAIINQRTKYFTFVHQFFYRPFRLQWSERLTTVRKISVLLRENFHFPFHCYFSCGSLSYASIRCALNGIGSNSLIYELVPKVKIIKQTLVLLWHCEFYDVK